MAASYEINNWYQNFTKQATDVMGIYLNNPKDAERLRVPTPDGKSTKPIFENGFTNSEQDKAMLYEHAKNGNLFAFSKQDNTPYQVTEQGLRSCEKADKMQEKKASIAQKIGFRATRLALALPVFGLGVAGRLLNLVTLGVFEKQINGIGKGLAMMANGLAEKVFSLEAQKREAENKVGLGERIGNTLTFGNYKKEKIQRIDRENTYEKSRNLMSDVLAAEQQEREEVRLEEALKKAAEKNKPQTEKELESTREKLKAINEPTQEREKEHIQNEDQAPEDKGKEMKTKLHLQYEEMRMAFGPGGGGFVEAVKMAQDMNRMIERLQNDEAALKASGMKKEDLKKFSNMCTNMESIMKEGLEAKEDLMVVERSQQLTAEQREQKLCQMQLMNMVERAMINSAYMEYMDKGKQPGMDATKMKNSRLFNAMERDPGQFKEKLFNDIKKLDSTSNLKEMTPEALSEFVSEPVKMRNAQAEDIRKGVEQRQEEREQQIQKQQQMQQRMMQMQQQQPQMQQPQLQQPQM